MGTFSLEKAKEILERKGRSAQLTYCLEFIERDTRDADALACLGHYYHNADETERDLEKAEAYYREAVLGGSELGETLLAKLICQYMHIKISFSENKVRLEHKEEKMDFPLDLERAESLLTWYGQVNNAQMEWIIPSVFVWLGYIYEEGLCGVEPNPEKAKACYKYAADRKDEEGEFRYADLMAYGDCKSNDPESYEYYQRSAQQGYVPAMLQLGRFILGRRHRLLSSLSSEWTTAFVAFLLGFMFLIPVGIMVAIASQYFPQVPQWVDIGMQIAGLFGLVAVCCLDIILILWGTVIKNKLLISAGLFTMGMPCLVNNEFSAISLLLPDWIEGAFGPMVLLAAGSLILGVCIGVPLEKSDYQKAFLWIQKAADTGDPEGIFEKAYVLFYNNFWFSDDIAEKNREEAIGCFEEAAEKGNIKAKIELGHLYRFGRNVGKNFDRAFELYRGAAEAGDCDGQYMVGYCYEKGIGVVQNLATADEWYRLGKKNGSKLAKERLNRPMRLSLLDKIRGNIFATEKLRIELEYMKQKDSDRNRQIEFLEGQNQQLTDRIAKSLEDGFGRVENALANLSVQLEVTQQELVRKVDEESGLLKENIDLASEALLSKFFEYCKNAEAVTIKKATEKSNESYYAQAKERLKEKFGDVWVRLQEDSRVSLISARTLYAMVKDVYPGSALDYSGIAISASSALENELSKLFFAGYIKYLKNEKIPFDNWPQSLTFKDKNGERQLKDHFTLGDLRYLLELGYNRKTKQGYTKESCSEYLKEYLKIILKDRYYDSRLPNKCFVSSQLTGGERECFIVQCEQIREQYRNPAAHAKTVGEELAKACCESIMGEYETARRLEITESVLMLLFELVK